MPDISHLRDTTKQELDIEKLKKRVIKLEQMLSTMIYQKYGGDENRFRLEATPAEISFVVSTSRNLIDHDLERMARARAKRIAE